MRDVATGFEPVASAFAKLLEQDETLGAQLAVYFDGDLVVDLAAGGSLDREALLPVYSSSKGAIGVVTGLLLQQGLLDLDATVVSYWPEFGAAGKSTVTVRQLLSHQAGLVGVDGGYSVEELLAHDPLATRLAAQRPYWRPGAAHGYHALTLGTLADQLVRRITCRSLSQIFAEEVASPRGIDVHLGTPAALDHRVRAVAPPTDADLLAWVDKLGDADPEALAAVAEPRETNLFGLVNEIAFRRVGQAASGALASARGLAAMYASLQQHCGQPPLLSDDVVAEVSQLQVAGKDLVVGRETRFAVAFDLPGPALRYGSPRAFGHGGLGGAVAFSDPTYGFTFGWIPSRLPGPSGGPRVVELITAVQGCCG